MSGRSRWKACACALAVGCVGTVHAGEESGLASQAGASGLEGIDALNRIDVSGGPGAWFLTDSTPAEPDAKTFAASFPGFGDVVVEKIDFETRNDPFGHADDIQVKAIPSPTAVFAGLALLGIVSVRRRRSA